MKELIHCRAMESLYRQGAALHPEDSWKLLAEAERWRHRALDQIASHFEECNGTKATASRSTGALVKQRRRVAA